MTVLRAGPPVPQSRCTSLRISGYVMTVTHFAPIDGQMPASFARSRNPRDVMLNEGIDAGRSHDVLGKVEIHARSVNLSAFDPTRADIDDALRAEAAKRGADAVVLVNYRTERAGSSGRGKMSASGYAVAFRP